MIIEHSKSLLLNADYTPIKTINWKRAIIWSMRSSTKFKFAIDIVDFYKEEYIQTINKKIPLPAVCRLQKYFKQKQDVYFSRENIFLRDNYTCQYCGVLFSRNNLTYDHVIPKSRWDYKNGSPTSWTNITTACLRCNFKKGDKTPKEANMHLLSLPNIPSKHMRFLPVGKQLSTIKNIPDEWKPYLPESYYL